MSEITYPGVYVQPVIAFPQGVVSASSSVTLFVGRTQTGLDGSCTTTSSLDEFVDQLGPVSASLPLSLAVRDFFGNGGAIAVVLSIGSPTTPLSEAQWLAAINGLGAIPPFNILALAPDVAGQDAPATVVLAAAAQCAALGAMVILGPLAAWQQAFDTDTLDTISADDLGPLPLTSRQAAAAYFPNLLVPDPATAALIPASPVGAVAGVWAATDASNGVWTAPAGVTHGLVGAGGLTAMLDDAQNQILADQGVNALRSVPNYGLVVWGARTLAGTAGSLDNDGYIQVQRTINYIRTCVDQLLQPLVFCLDDQTTWTLINQEVGGFLDNLWSAGGLVGATAAQAYSVICDATNNPPSDILAGVVNVTVQVALTQPAEFQVIEFQYSVAPPG